MKRWLGLVMDYELTHKAFEDLKRIQTTASALFPTVIDHIKRLGMDAVGLGVPSYIPYPPGYELFQFTKVLDNKTHVFTILFRIQPNEDKFVIYRIGHVVGSQ